MFENYSKKDSIGSSNSISDPKRLREATRKVNKTLEHFLERDIIYDPL